MMVKLKSGKITELRISSNLSLRMWLVVELVGKEPVESDLISTLTNRITKQLYKLKRL